MCIIAYMYTCKNATLHTCILVFLHMHVLTYLHTCILAYLMVNTSLSEFLLQYHNSLSNLLWLPLHLMVLEEFFAPQKLKSTSTNKTKLWRNISSSREIKHTLHFQNTLYCWKYAKLWGENSNSRKMNQDQSLQKQIKP